MSEHIYHLTSQDTIQLPKSAIRRIAQSRDANAALLYLYLASVGGVFNPENAASTLKMETEAVEEAMKTLLRLGVLLEEDQQTVVSDERGVYSQDEVADGLKNDSDFKGLVHETEQQIGKFLTPQELNLLYATYHELLLPADVLLMCVAHCVQETQRKQGPGRKPTIRQIEREARVWAKDGVNDTGRADHYLKAKDQYRDTLYQMLHALQIYGRSPTVTEEKYIRQFVDMGFGPDALYKAYDITMVKNGKLKWDYLTGILKNWDKKNIHTSEEIEAAEKKGAPAKQAPKEKSGYQPGKEEMASLDWIKQYSKQEEKGDNAL